MADIEYDGRPVTIYENPIPHIRSRHGYFPNVVMLPSGELVAAFVLGEAFDSANCTTWITRSADGGNTWLPHGPISPRASTPVTPTSDSMKISLLRDSTLLATGYRFDRTDPDGPICIPETSGMLPGDNIVCSSSDFGLSWSKVQVLPRSRPELVEWSGPCVQTCDGDVLGFGALLPLPDGTNPSGRVGVVLRSSDSGRTWDDRGEFFRSDAIVPFESRATLLGDGRIAVILWAYAPDEGKHLPNQVVVSSDNGKTWSAPVDTGIRAQASTIALIEGDLLLVANSHREADPGLWVRVIDFRKTQWNVMAECLVYGRSASVHSNGSRSAAEMFRSLRFGQPCLVRLSRTDWLVVHWCIEDGQGRITGHRIRVTF